MNHESVSTLVESLRECIIYKGHFDISLALYRDATIVINILIKFERNLKIYIQVTRHLF